MTQAESILGLLLFVLITFAAALAGAQATRPALDDWYAALEKPWFSPPDWVFGPVWAILYTMMAVAAWLVWSQGGLQDQSGPLGLYLLQLGLNVLWSVVFFGWRRPGLAFLVILALLAAILATLLAFAAVDPLAGLLLVPYLLWVGFAALLNYAIWRMN